MSNAEKQATEMVSSLSRRVNCLQIAVESGVEERQKQEEYIHMLQVIFLIAALQRTNRLKEKVFLLQVIIH